MLVGHLVERDLAVTNGDCLNTATLTFSKLLYILYVCEDYLENHYFVYYYGIKLYFYKKNRISINYIVILL
jgi:hypothetical protein